MVGRTLNKRYHLIRKKERKNSSRGTRFQQARHVACICRSSFPHRVAQSVPFSVSLGCTFQVPSTPTCSKADADGWQSALSLWVHAYLPPRPRVALARVPFYQGLSGFPFCILNARPSSSTARGRPRMKGANIRWPSSLGVRRKYCTIKKIRNQQCQGSLATSSTSRAHRHRTRTREYEITNTNHGQKQRQNQTESQ